MTPEQIAKIVPPLIPASMEDLMALIAYTWNNARNQALEEAAFTLDAMVPVGLINKEEAYSLLGRMAYAIRALKHKDGQP